MVEKRMRTKQEILVATTVLSPYDSMSTIVKIGDDLLVKYDAEINTTFIVMDFIPGQTLEAILPSLTAGEKLEIGRRLQEALGNMCEGPDAHMSGPFNNQAEFNDGLLRKLSTMPEMAAPFMDLLRNLFSQAFTGHRTVFTHGDLQPKNMMVHSTGTKEDGKGEFQISLIDWETSAWYPEYREFCHALVVGRFKSEWQAMVNKIMPVYGCEYTLMQMVFHFLYW